MMRKSPIFGILIAMMGLLTACATPAPPATSLAGTTPDLKRAAQYNVQLGVAYLQQGDVPRARQKLILATQQDPNAITVWNAMAYFMQTTDNDAQAQQAYQKALALDPHDGDTLNNYGVFLCHQGQPKTAIRYFQQAVQDPNYANIGQTYENAGLCSLKMDKTAQAKQFFTQALANDPTLATSREELAKLVKNKV